MISFQRQFGSVSNCILGASCLVLSPSTVSYQIHFEGFVSPSFGEGYSSAILKRSVTPATSCDDCGTLKLVCEYQYWFELPQTCMASSRVAPMATRPDPVLLRLAMLRRGIASGYLRNYSR